MNPITAKQRNRINDLKNHKEEMKRCEEDPVYFYNEYIIHPGKKRLTEDEYHTMVSRIERDRRRVRRGGYINPPSSLPVLLEDVFRNTNKL